MTQKVTQKGVTVFKRGVEVLIPVSGVVLLLCPKPFGSYGHLLPEIAMQLCFFTKIELWLVSVLINHEAAASKYLFFVHLNLLQ